MPASRASIDGPLDAALGVDQVGDAARDRIASSSAGAVGEGHLALSIGQQSEWESMLVREGPIGLGSVEGHAEDLDATRLEFAGSITEPDALSCSA